MFFNLYLGELKKGFSWKTAIVMVVILLILFLAIGLNLDKDYDKDAYVVPNIVKDQEEAEYKIAQLEGELKALEEVRKREGFEYYRTFSFLKHDAIYETKAELNFYKYVKANNLYGKNLVVHNNRGISAGNNQFTGVPHSMTSDGFVSFALDFAGSVLVIFGIVIGANIMGKEMRAGTLKMLFVRPVTRNKLYFSKILAIVTLMTAATTVALIIAVIFGYARFENHVTEAIFSFNGGAFSTHNTDFQIFLKLIMIWITVISSSIIAYNFSIIGRNRVVGIIVPLLLNALVFPISMLGLGRFYISENIDMSRFIGLSSSVYPGDNFFITLAMYMVYMLGIGGIALFLFRKRDIA